MAESIESGTKVCKTSTDSDNKSDVDQKETDAESENLECAVCLQTCVHPAQLPCGHTYCFLCVKGLVLLNKECAMCRKEIPSDYLDKPQLLEETVKEVPASDQEYHWFYEGRNGWWQYEERVTSDIEQIFKLGEPELEIMICGTLYIIDFANMQQYCKYNPRRKRRIKRDLKSFVSKGIAGIHVNKSK